MVSASSNACVGCSCVPSPALITGICKCSRDEIGGAGTGVAHHDAVGLHRVERVHGIEKRFAFFQAGRFGLQVHAVCAEARCGGGETDSRARGRLKECERHTFSAQRGQFFQRMLLNFLKWFGLIQQKCNLLGRKSLECRANG